MQHQLSVEVRRDEMNSWKTGDQAMAISYDKWMEPPCSEAVYLRVLAAGRKAIGVGPMHACSTEALFIIVLVGHRWKYHTGFYKYAEKARVRSSQYNSLYEIQSRCHLFQCKKLLLAREAKGGSFI